MTIKAQDIVRHSLVKVKGKLKDYGKRTPADCDLSLVAGPFIWEKEIRQALKNLPSSYIREYPLPNQFPELLELITEYENLPSDWALLTPGADIAIEILLRQILDPGDKIAILCPNFPRFEVVAKTITGVICSNYFSIDELPGDAKLISICTPCNPSTEEIPFTKLKTLISSRPNTIFCIDGVFDWYSEYSLSSLCNEYPNVILLKSFSKLGLAGLRLGYILSSPELYEYLLLGQSPFAVPAIIQHMGLYIAHNLHRISEIKEQISQDWQLLHDTFGDKAIRQSPVPFYLLQTSKDSDEAAQLLSQDGISVVSSSNFRGIPENVIRIAIGNYAQNVKLIKSISKFKLID